MQISVKNSIKRIRAYVAFKGWSKLRFAREAGVIHTLITDFNKESWNPTRVTIEKLEKVIPEDFIIPTEFK